MKKKFLAAMLVCCIVLSAGITAFANTPLPPPEFTATQGGANLPLLLGLTPAGDDVGDLLDSDTLVTVTATGSVSGEYTILVLPLNEAANSATIQFIDQQVSGVFPFRLRNAEPGAIFRIGVGGTDFEAPSFRYFRVYDPGDDIPIAPPGVGTSVAVQPGNPVSLALTGTYTAFLAAQLTLDMRVAGGEWVNDVGTLNNVTLANPLVFSTEGAGFVGANLEANPLTAGQSRTYEFRLTAASGFTGPATGSFTVSVPRDGGDEPVVTRARFIGGANAFQAQIAPGFRRIMFSVDYDGNANAYTPIVTIAGDPLRQYWAWSNEIGVFDGLVPTTVAESELVAWLNDNLEWDDTAAPVIGRYGDLAANNFALGGFQSASMFLGMAQGAVQVGTPVRPVTPVMWLQIDVAGNNFVLGGFQSAAAFLTMAQTGFPQAPIVGANRPFFVD